MKRLLRAGVVVLLATSLPGCWLQVGFNAGNTRFNDREKDLTVDNVQSLSTEWTVNAKQTIGGIASSVSEPVVSGGRLYVTSVQPDSSGSSQQVAVHSYDIRSGRLVWKWALGPERAADADVDRPVEAGAQPVVLVDDVLWVPYWYQDLAHCSGKIAALDPATGDVIADAEAGRPGSPLVAKGSIVASTEAIHCGRPVQLVVRDRDSLKTLWTYTFPSRTVFDATPTIVNGKVFVTFGGVVYAFDSERCGEAGAECQPMWTRQSVTSQRPVEGPHGRIIVVVKGFGDEGVNLSLHGLDSQTGATAWQTAAIYGEDGVTGIAVSGETVYLVGARGGGPIDPSDPTVGRLDAYQPGPGCPYCGALVVLRRPVWNVPLGASTPTTAPVVAGGVVYTTVTTPGEPSAVVAADAAGCGGEQCHELVRVPLDGQASTALDHPYQLSVARGRVFVAWVFNAFVPVTNLTSLAPVT